ncbi:hypothetical protein CF8_0018 [Aeromonas phage CF8]|nr:hypothetical protein CF8_0018 [Aeromonas phage CF8]
MRSSFQFGVVRDVAHLKTLMGLLHRPVYTFEKHNRFHEFMAGRKVRAMVMKGFYIQFHHCVRQGKKWIDISYSVREGNLSYFIGSFEFMRYSTKAHIVKFITQQMLGIMFDRMLLQNVVVYEGENVLAKIKNANTSLERAFWDAVRNKLKKQFMGIKSGSESDLLYLRSIPVQF